MDKMLLDALKPMEIDMERTPADVLAALDEESFRRNGYIYRDDTLLTYAGYKALTIDEQDTIDTLTDCDHRDAGTTNHDRSGDIWRTVRAEVAGHSYRVISREMDAHGQPVNINNQYD